MQKTKKNWALRILSLVLMFTLVSTCLLSGTLAKYVTTGSGADTARVAKWGVEVTPGASMFQTEYATDSSAHSDIITLSVLAVDGEKVVAPGTSGDALSFSITGMPEVACEIVIDITGEGLNEYWVDETGAPYEPIVWTLNGTAYASLDALIDEIETMSNSYAPNVDLASIYGDFTIGWVWDFYTDDASDEKDTFLGDQVAKGIIPTIDLSYAISVTQID